MIVLGIESTCDETAASIVVDGFKILSNVIASQDDIHSIYGGVFPELASRRHVEVIIPIIEEAIRKAKISIDDIDLISVANKPGLIGSILIGLNTAKALAFAWNKPFVGINHIEAHLYAAMMTRENLKNLEFPAIGVVISGGHTLILEIENIGKYRKLGTTIDDAIGEAFDKTANILGLSYPGGPAIEKLAKDGDDSYFSFKKPKIDNNIFNFSFSGLKTKVLYTAKGQGANKNSPLIISENEKKHLAASFQRVAFEDVIEKTFLAADQSNAKAIYIGGGVSNNRKLRENFDKNNFKKFPIYWPPFKLSLDNAAMIAGLAYHKFVNQKISDPFDLEAETRV